MTHTPIPDLISQLITLHGGNTEQAASAIGTSAASLSRWRSGKARPRKQQEDRLRALVDGQGDLVAMAETPNVDPRMQLLEEAISSTLHALREEFHRTASVSSRQEVLDLVAVLVFAHVTSIDTGGNGIGEHLRTGAQSAVSAVNRFMTDALVQHLPVRDCEGKRGGPLGIDRFFGGLPDGDERFAQQLLKIFERDAGAFRTLHKAGRDDLINEVFSRFMSTSFVDEKEMGQYLTPPEITRFMVEMAFETLAPGARDRVLNVGGAAEAGIVLDPSCGVGSFLAETIRFCHATMRAKCSAAADSNWLSSFVAKRVVGIDKSERMLRLAMINLGLFGAKAANLRLANALAQNGEEGQICESLNGRVELILTNPPFGATYSGEELCGFAMGRDRGRAESEVLFLERYVDWLAPGGVVASVVPDSILVNRNAFAQLRAWLKHRCSVEAVISLPPVTFAAAGTNTKTSVLILRKHRRDSLPVDTYFAEAREVGFDVVTRSGQRRRVRSARNDLPAVLADYVGKKRSGLARRVQLDPNAERWDAAFHVGLPDNIAAVLNHSSTELIKVSEVARLIDERVDPRRQRTREFDYVEISDIDTRTALVGHKRLLTAEAPSRARKLVRAGDVLVSTVRPERGAVGLTPKRLDGAICSTGFAVLRCTAIHPLALVWLLKTDLVRKQMVRNNIGIAYPAISETSCLDLRLPITGAHMKELTAAAEALAAAQEQFEAAQGTFLAEIRTIDSIATGTHEPSGKIPNLVDAAEPSAVPNAA